MRNDLKKLVRVTSLDVCGERRLHSRGICRDLEVLPGRQSMRSSLPHYTYPRVNLSGAPLRWLEKQAGRPWDDVYSELKQQFDVRSFRGYATLDRLVNQVEKNVFIEDGIPKVRSSWGTEWEVGGLYIHPHTNTLESHVRNAGRAKQRRERRQRTLSINNENRVLVSDKLQLHRNDEGLWFWVELAPVVPPRHIHHPEYISAISGQVLREAYVEVDRNSVCRDALTGQDFFAAKVPYYVRADLAKRYGPAHDKSYAVRKWQASHRDIARHVMPVLNELFPKAA